MYLNVPSKYRHQLPSLGRAWGPGMSAKGFRLPSPLVLLPVEWNSRFPTSCSPLTSVVRCKNDMFAVGVCQSRAPELWLLQFTFTSIHSSGRQGEKGRNSERASERERERERERENTLVDDGLQTFKAILDFVREDRRWNDSSHERVVHANESIVCGKMLGKHATYTSLGSKYFTTVGSNK